MTLVPGQNGIMIKTTDGQFTYISPQGTTGTGNGGSPTVFTAQDKIWKIVAPFGYQGDADFICDADATLVINSAISATDGAELYFLPGTYYISGKINYKDGVNITGMGNVKFICQTSEIIMIDNGVSHYASNQVSISNVTAGDITITASDVLGLSIGDFLKISDGTIVYDRPNGEIVRISEINGNVLTLEKASQDSYTETPVYRQISMWENITFKNINFYGPGINTLSCAFMFYGAYNLKFLDCLFENWGYQATQLWDVVDCIFDKCIFRNNFYLVDGNGIGYAIGIFNASDNITVNNCRFEKLSRHYIATGAGDNGNISDGLPRHITITGCTFETCTAEAINMHAPSRVTLIVDDCKFYKSTYGVVTNNNIYSIISNCIFQGVSKPIITYGTGTVLFENNICGPFTYMALYGNTVVQNNHFETQGQISTDNAEPQYTPLNPKFIIKDNVFKDYIDECIVFTQNAGTVDVLNNDFSCVDGIQPFTDIRDTTGVRIIGNKVYGRIETHNCDDVIIEKNNVEAVSFGIRLVPAGGESTITKNFIKTNAIGVYLQDTVTNANRIKIIDNYTDCAVPIYNLDSLYTNVISDVGGVVTVAKNNYAKFICANYDTDSLCITAALEAMVGGGEIVFAEGTYLIDTAFRLPPGGNIVIRGEGNVIFQSSMTNDYLFYTMYDHYSASTVSISSVAAGATSITASDVTGLAAGDYLKLSDATTYGGSTNGEIVKILSIVGSTINLEKPVFDSYTSSPVYRKIALFENIRFENITFIGANQVDISGGLELAGCYNVQIKNCHFRNFGYWALGLWDVQHALIEGCTFKQCYATGGNGYVISLVNACDNVKIKDCIFERDAKSYIQSIGGTDHNRDGGLLRSLYIEGCTFESSTLQGIYLRANSRAQANITKCRFLNCSPSIQLDGTVTSIIQDNFFSTPNIPLSLTAGSHLVSENNFDPFTEMYLDSEVKLFNNTFNGSGLLTWNSGQPAYDINIIGNKFLNYSSYALYVLDGTPFKKIKITDNIYKAASAGLYFIYLRYATDCLFYRNITNGALLFLNCGGVDIRNNYINTTVFGIRVSTAAGTFKIKENEILNSTYGISLEASGANSSVIQIRRNEITSGTPVRDEDNYYSAKDDDGVRI